MIRDPFYADQTGNIIAQAGGDFANRLMQLPGLLRENAEWKKHEAAYKSKQDFKGKLFSAVQNDLRKIGVDPAAIQMPDPNNPEEDPADFAAKIGKVIYPHFVGAGNKLTAENAASLGLAQDPNISNAVGQQAFLNQYEPLNQINLNNVTPQQKGPIAAYPAGEINEMTPTPQDHFEPLAAELVKQVRSGHVSADKAFDRMGRIEELKLKQKLEDSKTAREEKKRADELWQTGIIGAADTNRIVDKEGKQLPALTRENIPTAGIGPKYPKEFSPNAGGGGLRDDKQKLDEQKFLYDKVKDTESRAIRMYNGKDEFGEPATYDQAKYENVMTETATNKMALVLHNNGLPLADAQTQAGLIMNAPFSYDQPTRGLPVTKDTKTGKWSFSLQYPGILEKLAQASRQGLTADDVLQDLVKRIFPGSAGP